MTSLIGHLAGEEPSVHVNFSSLNTRMRGIKGKTQEMLFFFFKEQDPMDEIPLVIPRMSDGRQGSPEITSGSSPALPLTGSRSWASHFPSLTLSVFIC